MLGNMPLKINVMLVMAPERSLPLLAALESCGIDVLAVYDCREARRILEMQPSLQVVLTDTVLPDGDWQQVLTVVAQGSANIAEVVVCSRLGDYKLWMDVLEQGGYDVLVEPYDGEEIKRILEGAAARCQCGVRASSANETLNHEAPSSAEC